MSSKTIIAVCIQVFLAQCITSQYMGAYENLAWNPTSPCSYSTPFSAPYSAPYAPFAAPYAAPYEAYNPASLAASNGGGLAVSSSSPIAPVGVSMMSENAIEGPLAVAGQIPFLGAVGVEGYLPTAGAGAISYGCGNGNVAILNEDLAGYGYGPQYAGPYNAPAYGCAGYY